MKKRLFASLLCLLLLMSTLFTACDKQGKTDDTDSGQTVSGETETGEPEDPLITMLPDGVDMGNRSFVMATEYGGTFGFDLEAFDGDPINEVLYERNMYIEERYKVVLETVAGQDNLLRTAHLAQSAEYDFVHPNAMHIGPFMIEGMLSDLTTTTYLNLDQPWWNQAQVNNFTCNNHLYAIAGDLTIVGQAFGGIVYNMEAYNNYGFEEDLYDAVYAGDWTMEKLQTMSKQASIKVEGSDEGNFYGIAVWENLVYGMMYGMGVRLLDVNAEGKFELGYRADKLTDIAEVLAALLYDPEANVVTSYTNNAGLPTSDIYTAFSKGNALFMTFDIGSMYSWLRDFDFDIGYLPYPKLDDEQKNYQVLSSSGFVGVPYYVKDLDQASIILEGLAIYSYQELRPVFFDKILLGRLSHYERDYPMLEFLHESKFFDVGLVLDTDRVAQNLLYNTVIVNGTTSAVTVYMKGHASDFQKIVDYANNIK